ncbi:MAG: hypothetical protein ACR2N0_16435 [Rubrobacteraceae bacterium]
MTDPNRELSLEELPEPPLFKLTDENGGDIFEETEVGGEAAKVGALFSSREIAEEFSEEAESFGMGSFSNLGAGVLETRASVEGYATMPGVDFLLVVAERGTGLFHASDVAARSSEESGGFPFPLHFFTDEAGESPLITVEESGGEILVAALFTSSEKAEDFRQRASHLDLPDTLGTIHEREGLSRHALVAERTGAEYAVLDPEAGTTEAIPLDELK